jgi:hypothetical protein
MIRKQSDDPDIEAAAKVAFDIIKRTLDSLPKAKVFDYGGHNLNLGEYEVCERCTIPIAEAQQAHQELLKAAEQVTDSTVKEHVELAAELFRLEAEAAKIRAEFHNGQGTEIILNEILGFLYLRDVHDGYDHSHSSKE